jgi:hypothetical protein
LRQLLKVPLLSKSKKISPEVYKALCLEGASGAVSAADELTAPKRIKVFIKLCSVFTPCEHTDYYHAIALLDSEVKQDLMVAWQPFLHARDDILVHINRRLAKANSVLQQVLYFLQEAHVQYLLRQYRSAFVDVFGKNAVPRERDAPLPAPSDKARGTGATRLPLDYEPSKVEDDPEIDVDMSNDASGSDFDHTRDGEDDEANTSVSFTTQQQARHLQEETTTTSDNTEAAGFGSDTSPRTESGDYDELSQAEAN